MSRGTIDFFIAPFAPSKSAVNIHQIQKGCLKRDTVNRLIWLWLHQLHFRQDLIAIIADPYYQNVTQWRNLHDKPYQFGVQILLPQVKHVLFFGIPVAFLHHSLWKEVSKKLSICLQYSGQSAIRLWLSRAILWKEVPIENDWCL